MRRLKKSKYKSVVIKKKRYYFYKITWLDITGDSGSCRLTYVDGFYAINNDNSRILVKQR